MFAYIWMPTSTFGRSTQCLTRLNRFVDTEGCNSILPRNLNMHIKWISRTVGTPPITISTTSCKSSPVSITFPASKSQCSNNNPWVIVLATGPGNSQGVRVKTRKTIWFSSRSVQQPNPQGLGGPNPVQYPSTGVFSQVWLDPSVTISSSVSRVCLFMVAFKYSTANRKILTFAHYSPFQINRPPR